MEGLEDKPQRVSSIQGIRRAEVYKYGIWPKHSRGLEWDQGSSSLLGRLQFLLPSKNRHRTEDHLCPCKHQAQSRLMKNRDLQSQTDAWYLLMQILICMNGPIPYLLFPWCSLPLPHAASGTKVPREQRQQVGWAAHCCSQLLCWIALLVLDTEWGSCLLSGSDLLGILEFLLHRGGKTPTNNCRLR